MSDVIDIDGRPVDARPPTDDESAASSRPARQDGPTVEQHADDRWAEGAGRLWHRVVFVAVALGWAPVSLVAWLAVAIAGFGWEGGGSFAGPTILAQPSGSAIVSVGMAVLMFIIGAIVIGSLARWSIPVRRFVSVAVAAVAWGWAPFFATWWVIAQ